MIREHDNTVPVFKDKITSRSYAFTSRIVTIGSAPGSTIKLTGTSVGSHVAHCIFSGGKWLLQHVDTSVPLEINGTKLKGDYALQDGDKVTIGKTVLIYTDQQQPQLSNEQDTTFSMVRELVTVAVALLRNKEFDNAARIVASVSRLLRCDAARLVGENADTGERETMVRYPPTLTAGRFSARAIEWAREAGRTIIMQSTEWEDQSKAANSLIKNAVASILCAPLRTPDNIIGYLYLDRLSAADPFTEEDSKLCDILVPLFVELLVNEEERRRLQDTIKRLQDRKSQKDGGMIFESPVMVELTGLARKLAATESPVLVTGETGTGKELMARYVHEQSGRNSEAFRAINCGAIPENLIESELFGHEKGAFTGAVKQKAGLFESADRGSVFLDEIGELPLALQVKLLRVLQEGEFSRVGGTETLTVNVRIIAATNRDLSTEVAQGRFRQDLFYRLNVLTIHLPPLRERGEDVTLLAEYFLLRYCDQFGLTQKQFSPEGKRALLSYGWPGNIRELENAVQKAAILSTHQKITASDIALDQAVALEAGAESRLTLKQARSRAEHKAITDGLEATGGNVSQTAKLLEIDRKWLMKKMDELKIDADRYRH